MKKVPFKSWGSKIFSCLVVFFTALLILPAMNFADEGTPTPTSGDGNGGFFSKWFSGIPGIFQELSPADVGHKPRVKPHFAFTQGYHSNARLGQAQADSAWQARVAPGITISVPSGKLYTELDYTYGFSTTQGRKTNANINTHNLDFLARYDLTADTIFGVGNNIQFSEVPGEPGDPFVLETATTQVKHRLSSKLSASLTDTFQWFEDKSRTRPNDFVDNGVAGAMSYDVTSDLSAGPSFAWNVRNFDDLDAKDYWQIQPAVSVSYRLGPKTTLGGHFGWTLREFDVKQGANDTQSELVYGASASHKLGRKFIWSVSYAKSLVDTFDTNFVFRESPVATALDNLDREFRVLKSHRLGTSATYNLNEKNSFNAFGDVQFIHGDEKDNVTHKTDGDESAMEIGTGYVYRFNRYITLDLLYSFGRRFTAENNPRTRQDYTFHKVTGGVNITI